MINLLIILGVILLFLPFTFVLYNDIKWTGEYVERSKKLRQKADEQLRNR